jgi:hypothetical protein
MIPPMGSTSHRKVRREQVAADIVSVDQVRAGADHKMASAIRDVA